MRAMHPSFAFLNALWPWNGDAMPDWSPDDVAIGETDEAQAEREAVEREPPREYPSVDLETKAAGVKYGNGKVKRTRYRRVDLSGRRVGVTLHQAGVERSEERWSKSTHRITGTRSIGPTGTRYRIHPIDVRLVCSNRLDRKPYHSIGIEVLGNFEGVDGSGRWYKPEVFGRGRASDAQIEALRVEIAALRMEVAAYGGILDWIAPHRVSGKNKKGKPNRQICCGSRIWSEVGEWAVNEWGLAMPGPTQTFGGLPIHEDWHGRFYDPEHRRMT